MAGPKKPYAVAPHGQAFGPRHVVSHRKSKFFGKMGKCRLPNCRLVAAFHFDNEPSPRFCSIHKLEGMVRYQFPKPKRPKTVTAALEGKSTDEEKCSAIMPVMKGAKISDFESQRKTHSREVNLKIFKIEPRGKLPTLRSQIKSSKTSLRLQERTSFQTSPFNFGQHLVEMCFGV